MKHFLLLLCLVLLSCSKETEDTHDSFIYSYSAQSSSFALKFNKSDSVYMLRLYPGPKENFYTRISRQEKDSLKILLKEFDFKRYDTTYIQDNLSDGEAFKFYNVKKSSINWLHVYGRKAPDELYEISRWFLKFEKNHIFIPTNTKQDYGNLNYIELPEPPPVPNEIK